MTYEVRQTPDFAKWHSGLKDHVAQDAITARLLRMQAGLIGKAKSVGGKVAEAVVDIGPGYRLYYIRRGMTLIVMLGGGNKSTQQEDIAAAQAMAKAMDQADKSENKQPKGKAKKDMKIETIPFDAAERLDRDSSKLFIINDALQSGDIGYIATAIGAVARASGGLSLLERLTGIKRQTLNKSFGKDGNPTLETLTTVLKALDLQLRVEPLGVKGESEKAREFAHV